MKTLSDQDWAIIKDAAERWRETTLHREEHKKLCDALERTNQTHGHAGLMLMGLSADELASAASGQVTGDPGDEI